VFFLTLFAQANPRFAEALGAFLGSTLQWSLTLALVAFVVWLTVRYIPHNSVGIVEKLWSFNGSVGEGNLVALDGQAAINPRSCVAACTWVCGAGSTGSTGCRW
jgi:hypothetical protein